MKQNTKAKVETFARHLPAQDDNEVHDVPAVPQVRAFVEYKSQSNDFYSSLKAKHSYEVGLCFFLKKRE